MSLLPNLKLLGLQHKEGAMYLYKLLVAKSNTLVWALMPLKASPWHSAQGSTGVLGRLSSLGLQNTLLGPSPLSLFPPSAPSAPRPGCCLPQPRQTHLPHWDLFPLRPQGEAAGAPRALPHLAPGGTGLTLRSRGARGQKRAAPPRAALTPGSPVLELCPRGRGSPVPLCDWPSQTQKSELS